MDRKYLCSLNVKRRLIQISVFIFFFAVYYSSHYQNVLIGTFYSFKIGPIHIVDPYIYLTYFVRNISSPSIFIETFIGFLIPIVIAFFLGRVFCSWVCPYNFLYEITDIIRFRLTKRKIIKYYVPSSPRYRYLVLLILIVLGILLPFFPFYVVLPGLLSTFLHQIILRSWGFVSYFLAFFLLIFVVDFFLVKRVWCNLICPTGVLLQIFTWRKGLRVVKENDVECGKCALCSIECPLGLTPHLDTHQTLCYNCGKCVAACERIRTEKNPLRFKTL